MTYTGTFELSDSDAENLLALYDEIKNCTCISQEEFVGKMIIEGVNSFSKKIMEG